MEGNANKVALVTGANKGIGRETARQLGNMSMTVLISARDESRGAKAAQELGDEGIDARFVHLDVTDQELVDAAARRIGEEFGRLDVLVNNAGIADSGGSAEPPARASEYTADQMRDVYEVNVFGVVAVTHAMLPLLRRSPSSRVVNMSSELGSLTVLANLEGLDPSVRASVEPSHGVLAYNSSKAALDAITVMYARELRDEGILVNAAAPGYTSTDLTGHAGGHSAEHAATVPVRAATLPDDGPTGRFLSQYGEAPW